MLSYSPAAQPALGFTAKPGKADAEKNLLVKLLKKLPGYSRKWYWEFSRWPPCF